MIDKFVAIWEAKKDSLKEKYLKESPGSYQEIFKDLITLLSEDQECHSPDPERIHVIDDGDYQGTYLFIVAEKGYQPSEYYSCMVSYGSCSGCDTFQAIRDSVSWDRSLVEEKDLEHQASEFVTLALHMLQSLKKI